MKFFIAISLLYVSIDCFSQVDTSFNKPIDYEKLAVFDFANSSAVAFHITSPLKQLLEQSQLKNKSLMLRAEVGCISWQSEPPYYRSHPCIFRKNLSLPLSPLLLVFPKH